MLINKTYRFLKHGTNGKSLEACQQKLLLANIIITCSIIIIMQELNTEEEPAVFAIIMCVDRDTILAKMGPHYPSAEDFASITLHQYLIDRVYICY